MVEREKQVLTEQARESGKPDAVIEKMIVGRLKKFLEEVTLLGQKFVINPDVTVAEAAKEAGALFGVSPGATDRLLDAAEDTRKKAEEAEREAFKAMGGLDGSQGVLIPKTNVKNLMLRSEVVEAVKAGKFRVIPVETIDQGLEISYFNIGGG